MVLNILANLWLFFAAGAVAVLVGTRRLFYSDWISSFSPEWQIRISEFVTFQARLVFGAAVPTILWVGWIALLIWVTVVYGRILWCAERAILPHMNRFVSAAALSVFAWFHFLVDVMGDTQGWLILAFALYVVFLRWRIWRIDWRWSCLALLPIWVEGPHIVYMTVLLMLRLRRVVRANRVIDTLIFCSGLMQLLVWTDLIMHVSVLSVNGTDDLKFFSIFPFLGVYFFWRRGAHSLTTTALVLTPLFFVPRYPESVEPQGINRGGYSYYFDSVRNAMLELNPECSYWSEDCAHGWIGLRTTDSARLYERVLPFTLERRARMEQILRFEDYYIMGVGVMEDHGKKSMLATLAMPVDSSILLELIPNEPVNRGLMVNDGRSMLFGGRKLILVPQMSVPVTDYITVMAKYDETVFVIEKHSYDPNRNVVYATDFLASNRLYIVSTVDEQRKPTYIDSGVDTGVAASYDSRNDRIWVAGMFGLAVLAPDGTVLRRQRTGLATRTPAIVDDINRVFVPDTVSGRIFEFEQDTMELVATHVVGFEVRNIESDPAVSYLISGSSGGTQVWPKSMWNARDEDLP